MVGILDNFELGQFHFWLEYWTTSVLGLRFWLEYWTTFSKEVVHYSNPKCTVIIYSYHFVRHMVKLSPLKRGWLKYLVLDWVNQRRDIFRTLSDG